MSSTVHLVDADRRIFKRLQLLRLGLGLGITVFLAHAVDLGIDPFWLIAAVCGGILYSGRLLKHRTAFFRTVSTHAIFFFFLAAVYWLLNYVITAPGKIGAGFDFLIPRFADDTFLVCLFYSAAFLSTWFFWVSTHAVTAEALLGSVFFVWLLSGHRNYHIDAPKEVSSLAWRLPLLRHLQVEPQHLFLVLGALFVLILLLYFCAAANRPIFGRAVVLKSYGRTQRAAALLCSALVLAGFAYFAFFLNARYSADLSRVSNGVGMDQAPTQGQSNLGFHKAISPTRQPAALVRLEGDYKSNPWSPMLYLREGALSEFNGRELVGGGLAFDADVPRIPVGQTYLLPEDKLPSGNRERVVQSIYLLTKHNGPIGIDIPQKISILKNPNPERFLHAYQVVSAAPVAPLPVMVGKNVGDRTWPGEMWDHYLRAPGSKSMRSQLDFELGETNQQEPVLDEHQEDLRYLALARRLTSATDDLVTKAAMIVNYLSQESIYTRSPEHQITERGDPVAPYLFSEEKKGYCVHFAHAAVYMMRLLGIPARISTGYLVDMTYAKDGHILLQLGDRHAWPEIYIQGEGWQVFDVTPARAENEPTLVPDEKLLEELMSKLAPAETMLEPLSPESEPQQTRRIFGEVLTRDNAAYVFFAALAAFLLLKLVLRFGYWLLPQGARRNALAYAAFASALADIGRHRLPGETRREYAERIQRDLGFNGDGITAIHEKSKYSRQAPALSRRELFSLLKNSKADLSRKLRMLAAVAFFSPLSLKRLKTW